MPYPPQGVVAGDMLKATYDPDADGKLALAQLVDAVCSETEAAALAHLIYQLTTKAKVLYIPSLLATDLAAGGGFIAYTGGTGSSTSIYSSLLRVTVNSDIGDARLVRVLEPSLNAGGAIGINWDKELYFQFSLIRRITAAGAQPIQGYVQIKLASTAGALAAAGIGIRILGTDGLDIRGESYNTEEGTADFDANLVESDLICVGIHHRPGVSVDFYVDGVLQTNIIDSAAQVPAGRNIPQNYVVVSLETTDDPNANVNLDVGGFLIVQAY